MGRLKILCRGPLKLPLAPVAAAGGMPTAATIETMRDNLELAQRDEFVEAACVSLVMRAFSTIAVCCVTLPGALVLSCGQALADDEKPSLSQQLANPIANLTSVPIQYNALFGAGRDGKGIISVLDIQPVIPFKLNDDWNLITRTILPVATTNNFLDGLGDASGLGDTQVSLFLSPEKTGPGGLIWGVGTVINIPTATDALLGTREWGAGPTAVALVQTNSWTVGVLASQMWTFDGDAINRSFIQPWVTYELKDG